MQLQITFQKTLEATKQKTYFIEQPNEFFN